MIKKFTCEGRFECGLDAIIERKTWAFTPALDQKTGMWRLGVAAANEAGYWPVPLHWCHADSYDEIAAHCDELNAAEGLSERQACDIISSSMAAGKISA